MGRHAGIAGVKSIAAGLAMDMHCGKHRAGGIDQPVTRQQVKRGGVERGRSGGSGSGYHRDGDEFGVLFPFDLKASEVGQELRGAFGGVRNAETVAQRQQVRAQVRSRFGRAGYRD